MIIACFLTSINANSFIGKRADNSKRQKQKRKQKKETTEKLSIFNNDIHLNSEKMADDILLEGRQLMHTK